MRRFHLAVLALAGMLATVAAAQAQSQGRPYIGFVYPAGGQQGTTFQVTLGGQVLDDVNQASVSGAGVTAKVIEYRRKLNPQETRVLRDQLERLNTAQHRTQATLKLMTRIQTRLDDFVQRPEAASLSNVAIVEVTIASDAKPGRRELTVATPRGLSNPLVFAVGQLPELSRKPMVTSEYEVLGKEGLALRHRPAEEAEQHVSLPATLNGQIASGEVNSYRFTAHKGQRLVFSTEARELIPFMADAVPGWFQPVLTLYDAKGKEVAYDDDYRFKPDPVIFYEVPRDGEYVLAINDAIFRGREDFVYRITAGELPFITGVFPLGGRAGQTLSNQMQGWNLDGAKLMLPPPDAAPGGYCVWAEGKNGFISNCVKFKLDALPECLKQEPNHDIAHAQKVTLPIIVNGRIEHPGDWDVFQFQGHAGQTIVAEVESARLDSPIDSFLKISNAAGQVLAFNDDFADPLAGTTTHSADSYVTLTLPADGTYYVHLGDTTGNGGEEYAYRLRIGEPQPDFALRVVPSTINLRSQGSEIIEVEAIRKDGFQGEITLDFKDPPQGFQATECSVPEGQSVAHFYFQTTLNETKPPVALQVRGTATIQDKTITHIATAAEDRMQAFLWRHLVPAQELKVLVFDPDYEPSSRRIAREIKAAEKPAISKSSSDNSTANGKPKFTRQQVEGRLRELMMLHEEGLLTDEFYQEMVAECDAQL